MKARVRSTALALLLLSLGGCAVVSYALSLPIRVLYGALAFTVAVIGSDGSSSQEELWSGGIDVDRYVVDVSLRDDLTYEAVGEVARTVTSTAGLKDAQQASVTFDPRSQELEVEWAEVVNPDGTHVEVGADSVFVRPSAAASATPGFASSQTMTVLFPQLRVGSKTVVRWRFRERGRSELGFNYLWRTPFAYPVHEARIRIAHPDDVPLEFEARGPFDVSEFREGGGRVVEATLRGYAGQEPERAMVDPIDVCPLFVATTVRSWEEIGARFHAAVEDRIEVTPAIREQAARITAGRTGLDAARAIHRWVARNVQYVAVYLGQMDGWVPHPASDVLANGYGDCKDQFVLLASLMRAAGIECQPALARLGRSFERLPLPTPLQFDHCLAYLPELDVWSDPTDPFRDLGELDVTLSDKFVVLGTPEGRVARTPEGSPDRNRYQSRHDVVLDANGRLSGTSVFEASGRPSGFVRRTFALAGSPDTAADGLLQAADGGTGDVSATDPADLETPFRGEARWEADFPVEMADTIHFPVPAGADFANPALIRRFVTAPDRTHPVVVAAVELRWTYDVRLPDEYEYSRTPPPRAVRNDAATYASRYRVEPDGRMRIERTLRVERDRFPAEQYAGLREALIAAGADGNTVLVAVRTR